MCCLIVCGTVMHFLNFCVWDLLLIWVFFDSCLLMINSVRFLLIFFIKFCSFFGLFFIFFGIGILENFEYLYVLFFFMIYLFRSTWSCCNLRVPDLEVHFPYISSVYVSNAILYSYSPLPYKCYKVQIPHTALSYSFQWN